MSYHATLSDISLKRALRKALSPRALVLGALGAPIIALAGPTGGQVVAGAADITTPAPNGTVIDQTSQSAVIDWQSFSIGSQEYVQFNQPDSSSIVLNRVVGGNPSSILGSLKANGQVFLVNPQGVFFGVGATLDVGGLVATTMDIGDSDFMAGRYVFTKTDGSTAASVVNAGAIQAHPGGYVVLAGDYTENSGVITAQAGHVVLAAGSQMTLDIGSGGLINFAVDQATLSSLAGVKNAGQVIADGGTVVMTAKVANSLVATAVNNEGLVQAHSVTEHNGVIILSAQGGDIKDSGTLDASATQSGVAGGYIRIRGDGHTEITSTASIDAAGSGARGGFIELSGHTLSTRGQVKLGHGGTLLIDPSKVSISTGSSVPSNTGATTYQVGVGYIQTQLNSNNNVVLVASNSIGHAGGVTSLSATGTGKLTLKTGTLTVVSTGASLGPPAGFQCWADGVCASPASGAAGATFTPTSGFISLFGMNINIAGAFEANAANGNVNVGNITANSVTVIGDSIRVGNVVTSGSAGINLTASDAAASVSVFTGSLTATGTGGIVVKTQGNANGSIYVGGAVSAGGAFTASAAVPSYGGNLTIAGAATAKRITITAQALAGGNITVQGLHANGTAASDGVMLSALASGGASFSGGNVYVTGSISAAKGGVGINATGSPNSGGIISAGGNIQAATFITENGGSIKAGGASFLAGQSVQASAGRSINIGGVSAPQIKVQAKTGNLTLGNLTASSTAAPVNIDVGTGPSGTAGGSVSVGSVTASGKEGSQGTAGASVHIYARANSGANIIVGGTGGITISAAKAAYTRSTSFSNSGVTVNRTSSGSSGQANLTINGGGTGASITVNGPVSVSGHGVVGATISGATTVAVNGAMNVTDSGGGSRTLTWTATSAGKTQVLHRTSPKWGAARVNVTAMQGSNAGAVTLGSVSAQGVFGDIFVQGKTITTGALTAKASGRSSDVRSGSLVVGSTTKTLNSSDNNFGSANIALQAHGGTSADVSVGGNISATASGGRAIVSLRGAHVITKGIAVSASASHVNLAGDVIPSSASYVFNYRDFKTTPDTITLGATLTKGTASMGLAYIDVAGAMPLGTGTGTGSPAPALSFAAIGNLSATGVGDGSVKINAAKVNVTGSITAAATAAHISASGATSGGITTHISGSLGAAGVSILGGNSSSDTVTVTGAISATGPMAQVQVSGKNLSLGSVSATGAGLNRTVNQTNSAASNVYSSTDTQGPARVMLTAGVGSLDSTSTLNVGNVTVSAVGAASVQLGAGSVTAGNVSTGITQGSRSVTGFPTGLNSVASFSGSGAKMQIGAYNSASVGNLSAPNIVIKTKHGVLVTGSLSANSANAPVAIDVESGTSGSGANITVNGSITASGQGMGHVNSGASAGAAAAVYLYTGYGVGHSINITGSVIVTGNAAPVSVHTSDASSSYTLTGSLGPANVQIQSAMGGSGAVTIGGALTVSGAGRAHVGISAASVSIGGPITISAAAGSYTQTSNYHYGSGTSASFDNMTTIRKGGIADLVVHTGTSPTHNVKLGAVSVSGTRASVSVRGHSVTAGNIAITSSPGTLSFSVSGSSRANGAYSLTSHAVGGGAQVDIIAGSSASLGSVSLGSVNLSGNGDAGLRVGGGVITTGALTLTGGAGNFTLAQTGTPYFTGNGQAGPWGQFGLDQGSASIGVATISINGNISSNGSSGKPPAANAITVNGAVSVSGKGIARVELVGNSVGVASTITATASKGHIQGTGNHTQTTSSGVTYHVTRTANDSVGSAEVSLGNKGGSVAGVGGAMTVSGTSASVEVLGANISVMGVSVTGGGGGLISEHATYTPTGSVGTAYSTSFNGPGDITGMRMIGSPSGSLNVQGPVAIQGQGFVGAILADGTVTTGNITLTATGSASYTVTDSRKATPTQTFTIGDVGLAMGQMSSGSAISQAAIGGNITLTAPRDVYLGIVGNASGSVNVAAGRDINATTPAYLQLMGNIRGGPGSNGSSITFPVPNISASAAAFTAGRNISMSGATVTVGSGNVVGVSGDAKAAGLAGLASTAAPNALFDAAGSLQMPNLTLNGNYVWLKAGQFVSGGAATIASGALVQVSPHTGSASVGLNSTGTGTQTTMIGVTPFLGAYAGGDTIAVGGTAQSGNIVLAGYTNLGSANVVLITSGTISGTGKLVSGGVTVDTSGSTTSLIVQTPSVTFAGSGALTVDDSAYTGTASFNLGSGALTTVSGTFGGNVNLVSPVNASAFMLNATGGINLGGQAINVTSAASFTAGGSFSATGTTIKAGSLTLNGGSSTDFNVNVNAATIQVGSGRNINITDSYASAANVGFGTGSFGSVALTFGGAGNITSGLTAQTLQLTAAGGLSNTGGTLAANAVSVSAGGAVNLVTQAASITVNSANGVTLNNMAYTGAAAVAFGAGSFGAVAVSFGGAGNIASGLKAQNLQLAAGGGLSNAGTLAANAVTVSAGGAVNLVTKTSSIQVNSATDVTLDNTAQTGAANIGFGGGTFGAVAANFGGNGTLISGFKGSALGMVAGGSLDVSGQTVNLTGGLTMVATNNIVMSGVSITAGTVSMTAGGSIHNGSSAGTVKANGLAMAAVGDILVPNTTFTIGSGSIAGVYGDAQLIQALASQGLATAGVTPSATFIAGGALDIGGLNLSGSYLYLQAQSLALPSSITAPAGEVVQFSPSVMTDNIGIEDAPATTATVNYSNQGDLSLFPGGTLVIGSSLEAGDVSLATLGAFDIGNSTLIIDTTGAITGLDTVTSTGIVTNLQTLLNGIFAVPTSVEVDPSSSSTINTGSSTIGTGSSSGGSNDDQNDKKKQSGDSSSGDNGSNDNTLIKHEQTEPSGICS